MSDAVRGDVDASQAGATSKIVWRPYHIYIVGLLLLITICNYLDRIVLNVLQEPIKRELRLSDWQLGLLSGPAFALFYSVAGIPVARLAERANRARLMAAVVAVWSTMTALCGFAQGFIEAEAAVALHDGAGALHFAQYEDAGLVFAGHAQQVARAQQQLSGVDACGHHAGQVQAGGLAAPAQLQAAGVAQGGGAQVALAVGRQGGLQGGELGGGVVWHVGSPGGITARAEPLCATAAKSPHERAQRG